MNKKYLVIIITVGILFLSIGVFIFYEDYTFLKKSQSATGIVVDLEYTLEVGRRVYYPIVNFTTEKNESITFRGRTGSTPPQYKIGDEVPVIYDPDNPYNARIYSAYYWVIPIVFVVVGSLCIFAPFLYFLSNKRKKRLLQYGRLINTEFVCVELKTNVKIAGKHPYVIISKWTDPLTQEEYIFKSDNIFFNPEPYIQQNQQKNICVYLNPKNMKKYFMDISFLPKID